MTTILLVMLFVFAGAAVLVITFGPLAYGLTTFHFRWRAWIGVWLWTLTCVGVVVGCCVLYAQKHPDHGANTCADRRGVWSVIGHHSELVGKVVTTVTDYGCVMPR